MRTRLFDVLAVAAITMLTALMRLPAVLSTRPLDFDEGVYGISVLAMRDGDLPFRDVFSSQGPLFLPLLRLFDAVGGGNMRAIRIAMVVAAVAVSLGTYVIARRVGDRWAALLGGVITGTSVVVLMAAGPVHSDGIALSFAVWAVAVAMGAGRLGRWRPVAVGLLIGAALAVKSLFVVPAGLAILWLFVARQDWKDLGIAAGSAVALGLAVTAPWGFSNVWDQSVQFQLDAPRNRSPSTNLRFARTELWEREGPVLVLVATGAISAVAGRFSKRRPAGAKAERAAIVVWLVATIGLLVFGTELGIGFERFLAFLIPPAVAAAVMARPPVLVVVLAALAVVPRHLSNNEDVIWRRDLIPVHEEVVAAQRALPDGALVISDRPGLVWVAGRHPPGDLVDPSWARIRSGSLSSADIVEATERPEVCAVLFYSGRFDWLDGRLAARLVGYELETDWGDGRRLYLRRSCSP